MRLCNKSSCTEVILVCPRCGVVTEAGALASPHCTERNFMWQRVEWNVRSLSGKHRWLCSFRCFGKGDGESAHSCKSVERRLGLLVSGMQMRCDLCQARGKICPQVDYKAREIWTGNGTMLNLIPDSEDEHAQLVCRPAAIWQAVRQSGLALGLVHLNSSTWQMLQLAIATTAECWRGLVSTIHPVLACLWFKGLVQVDTYLYVPTETNQTLISSVLHRYSTVLENLLHGG